jgi:hypothetical protein
MVQRLMPFVEWSSGFLPENVSEHLDFDPQEQSAEGGAEEEEEVDEKAIEADESNNTK